MTLTVDASVFVAASKSSEPHHASCEEFFLHVARRQDRLECPYLMLVEIAAAIARGTRNPALSLSFLEKTQAIPLLHLRPLDGKAAKSSAEIAIAHYLRGADAVYVALARDLPSTLI